MSVFEAREWWASPDGEDMCTGTCLAVDAVVPSQDGSFNDAQIVAGTFSGSLRVYQPSQGGFQPEVGPHMHRSPAPTPRLLG